MWQEHSGYGETGIGRRERLAGREIERERESIG